DILREGETNTVSIPLVGLTDSFIYRNSYDTRPEYYVIGGLVFSPLSRNYLRLIRHSRIGISEQRLLYYSDYAKLDSLYEGKNEFIVLIKRLPHSVNTYTDPYINGIVKNVNGNEISCMQDLVAAFATPSENFHVVEFEDHPDCLVIDAEALPTADSMILNDYRVTESMHLKDAE
ncbi:MAG: hypothetical protein JXN60_00950, partial [Lentisphaerae bacterium]|nr:hypothetical protein [Lentisphaerota bacterium]